MGFEITQTFLQAALHVFSPLGMATYFWIRFVSSDYEIERPELLILFGWCATFSYATFYNQRVLYLNSFFTAMLAGRGFQLLIESVKERF